MAYLSLYRKYRSQRFSELLGQDHVSQTLSRAVTEGRVAHAYLFTGPRGTGKTSAARILAKAINCEQGPTPEPCGVCNACVAITEGSSLDVIELDAASHSKVEETRDILLGVPLATAGGRRKVYVIDEVHMLTTQSFNALLKTLEEPPDHVVFVLATTEAHKVLPTIVSRTQRFDFRRIAAEVIETHLGEVAKLENADVEPDVLALIARHSDGSMRDALSMLEQMVITGSSVSLDDAEILLGEHREDALRSIFDSISAGEIGGVFSGINSLMAAGADPRQLALGALEHARSLLLLRTSPQAGGLLDVPELDRAEFAAQAERFTEGHLIRMLELLGKAVTDMRMAPNHRLLLEVALVRATAPETDPSAAGLLGRIERLERRLGIEDGDAVAAPAPVAQTPSPRPRPARAASRPAKPEPTTAAPAPAPAPQEAPPEEAVVRPPSGSDVIGLGHIRDAWPATMKEVNRKTRRVGAYLNPSRPVDYDGETLVIEVQSAFHRDAMKEEANTLVIAEAVNAAIGTRPKVTFVERGGAVEQPQEQPADVSVQIAEAEATETLDPVELVRQGLGAEVVEEIEGK